MEEKKVNYGLVIFVIVVIILFIPIIIDYVNKQNIEVLSSDEIREKINSDESFFVYVGDVDKQERRELRNLRDITKNDYSYQYVVYNVKKSEDIEKILGDDVVAAIIIEGDIQEVYTKYDKKILNNDVKTYLVADITEDNASFKVAKNFKSYKKIINSDKAVATVFGRESCSYCNKFKPVYNAVAQKYDLEVYYFDSDSYDATQYKKIINMDLTIPAKCSSTGNEYKLSEFTGTPLTIITKKGKVIDCISGYVNRSRLIDIFKANKMISE